jgi:two-component system sensor histidine kinase RegB
MPEAPAVHRGIGLPWLAAARWATLAAQAGAALMGATVLDVPVRWSLVAGVLGVTAVTNLWLSRQGARTATGVDVPALLVVLDVVGLAIVLFAAGGPLNPVSIYFLVLITQAAFVHGARVASVVAGVSTGLYGLLFVAVTPELHAALAMHPEVAHHFRGMWWAFAATAALVTTFVARLARAVAQRDAAVRALEGRLARTESLTRLATLAADAAHELGTPLGTIALTAGELERDLAKGPRDLSGAIEDVRLIREESHRCRAMLDDMAGRAGQPAGRGARRATVAEVVERALAELSEARRGAVQVAGPTDVEGLWPVEALSRALLNVLRNAFDASPPEATVRLEVLADGPWLRLDVIDTGAGMTDDVAAEAFEPFFTTRPGTGRGLGLVVVRQTLEMLGGRVDLHTMPGAGTRVSLMMPLEGRP